MLSAVAHLTQVILSSDFWNFAGALFRLFSSIYKHRAKSKSNIWNNSITDLIIENIWLKILNKNIYILIFASADWRRYEDYSLESDINLIFTPNGIHSQNMRILNIVINSKYFYYSIPAELKRIKLWI